MVVIYVLASNLAFIKSKCYNSCVKGWYFMKYRILTVLTLVVGFMSATMQSLFAYNAVNTNDTTDYTKYIILLIVAVVLIIILWIWQKKKK